MSGYSEGLVEPEEYSPEGAESQRRIEENAVQMYFEAHGLELKVTSEDRVLAGELTAVYHIEILREGEDPFKIGEDWQNVVAYKFKYNHYDLQPDVTLTYVVQGLPRKSISLHDKVLKIDPYEPIALGGYDRYGYPIK